MSDDNPVHMPDGDGVDIAVEGDEEKPGDTVDVPGNVDRPEFRKDLGKATIRLSLKRPAQY